MVGRHINLRTEIKPVATEQLLSTFLMQGQCVLSVSRPIFVLLGVWRRRGYVNMSVQVHCRRKAVLTRE